MGFSDFKETRGWWHPTASIASAAAAGGSYTFIGDNNIVINSSGSGGGGVLHASLSNPLTASGIGLRCKMLGAKLKNNGSWGGSHPNPSFNHMLTMNPSSQSNFNLIPSTKAISLRAWVRSGQPTSNNGNAVLGDSTFNMFIATGLIAKASTGSYSAPGSSLGMLSPPDSGNAGYRLGLSNFDATTGNVVAGSTLRLKLFALSNNKIFNASNITLSSIGAVTCSGSYSINTWYHLRLDVIPGGVGSDLLIAYTGNGAENEVWTEVGRLTVPSSDGAAYCQWSSNAYSGYGIYQAGAVKSYQSTTIEASSTGFFDKFEAFVEDV